MNGNMNFGKENEVLNNNADMYNNPVSSMNNGQPNVEQPNVLNTSGVNNNINDNQVNSVIMNSQGDLICAKCGAIVFNRTISYCQKCGNNFSNILNNGVIQGINQNSNLNTFQYNDEIEEKTNGGRIVFLILSILNLLIIVPIIVRFGLLWMIFGAFSNNKFLYISLLLVGCGYAFASIFGLIVSIINIITKGRISGKCFKIILVGFCLGIIIPIVLSKINYSPAKYQMKKNNLVESNLVENKIVYQDDDLTIEQVKIVYDNSDVKVYFKALTSNINNYSFPIRVSIRVNKCVLLQSATVNQSEDNLYYLSIPYNYLNPYNIKDIATIEFSIFKKNIKFELESNGIDMIETIGLDSNELIYSNDYFKLYFDSDYNSTRGYLYFQSVIPDNYSLSIFKADFNTKGHLNERFTIQLNDYSITQATIYFHPCYENMHYVKFDYDIRDENFSVIAEDHVEVNFSDYKVTKKFCRET